MFGRLRVGGATRQLLSIILGYLGFQGTFFEFQAFRFEDHHNMLRGSVAGTHFVVGCRSELGKICLLFWGHLSL